MKIIKKSKKLIGNFLITLLVAIFGLSSFAGIALETAKNTFALLSAGSPAVVRITSESNTSSASAGKDGTINYRISATNVNTDVTVYYRTVSGSAIEEKNYTAIPTVYGGLSDSGKIDLDGRITLNPGQTYKDLSIQTTAAKYSTSTGSVVNNPCFYIEIYAVINGAVENGRGTLTCYVKSEHDLKYQNNTHVGSGYVFSEYKTIDVSDSRKKIDTNPYNSPILDNDFEGRKYQDWFMVSSMKDSNRQKTWENDFIQTDIASAFFATDFYANDINVFTSWGKYFVKYYADYKGPSINTKYQGSYSMNNWYDCSTQFAALTHRGRDEEFDESRTLTGFSFDQILDIFKKLFPDSKESDISTLILNKMQSYNMKSAKIQKKGGDVASNHYVFGPQWFYGISADNMLFVPYSELMDRGSVKYEHLYDTKKDESIGNLKDFWSYVNKKNLDKAAAEFFDLIYYDGITLYNNSWWGYDDKVQNVNKTVMPEYTPKMFFQIPKGDLNICVHFYTDTKLEKQLQKIVNSYVLEDITAPTVVSVTGTDRNFDNSVSNKSKTRVSVRFSEPVYVTQANIDAGNVKLNGKLSLVGGETRAVKLSYSGGSGTDTLFFDLDKSNSDYFKVGDNVQELIVTDISGANYICDYAYTAHHPASAFSEEKKITCVYDYRTPIVKDITGDGSAASIYPQKVQIMKINTRDISDTGFIYYAWSDSDLSEGEAKNLNYTKTRVTGDHTQVKIQEGNGRFYLYAYAESALKIRSSGIAKGSTLLDNIEPKVSSISDNSESTTRHSFKLKMEGFGGSERAELGKVYLLY
ncbi:MAG: Ig-like domain-containing protein, partial [Clostridia bacterium]|nr:Ig-like domain-containing protein [Clostridia bacterium]